MAVKRVTTVARPAQTTHDALARRHSSRARQAERKDSPKGSLSVAIIFQSEEILCRFRVQVGRRRIPRGARQPMAQTDKFMCFIALAPKGTRTPHHLARRSTQLSSRCGGVGSRKPQPPGSLSAFARHLECVTGQTHYA